MIMSDFEIDYIIDQIKKRTRALQKEENYAEKLEQRKKRNDDSGSNE